jgi:hypothetical protein
LVLYKKKLGKKKRLGEEIKKKKKPRTEFGSLRIRGGNWGY